MAALFSVAQIRQAERLALARGQSLMALAGARAADFLAPRLSPLAQVLALVGPGNNGGDALVAATCLRQRGFNVSVCMPGDPAKFPADSHAAYQEWTASGGSQMCILPTSLADVVIDGIFGIGLNRPLSEPWQDIIDTINAWKVPVLALDIPSGIDADTGVALGRPLKASWTLSFIGQARGLMSNAGRDAAGECHLETLGVTIDVSA